MMMFITNLTCYCKDNDEFIKIKNQVENSFSIGEKSNVVYIYEKERIISLNNNWFAILHIEDKPTNYAFSTLKVLHKIFEKNVSIEDLKKQNKINIVKSNNKGILYCDYSQIKKMEYK